MGDVTHLHRRHYDCKLAKSMECGVSAVWIGWCPITVLLLLRRLLIRLCRMIELIIIFTHCIGRKAMVLYSYFIERSCEQYGVLSENEKKENQGDRWPHVLSCLHAMIIGSPVRRLGHNTEDKAWQCLIEAF